MRKQNSDRIVIMSSFTGRTLSDDRSLSTAPHIHEPLSYSDTENWETRCLRLKI